jgi:hypothetical protein
MGTELVPETLYSNELTRLCALENYIESCRRECFKTYMKLSHLLRCLFCVLLTTDNKSKTAEWIFRLIRKSRKSPVTFVTSVSPSVCLHLCPQVSARLPLDGFPWNLILGTSMKICRENTNLPKIGQTYLTFYLKPCVSFIVTGDLYRYKSSLFDWNGIRLLVRQSICLSACICVHPAWRIYVKFYIGDFHKNLSINSKFG